MAPRPRTSVQRRGRTLTVTLTESIQIPEGKLSVLETLAASDGRTLSSWLQWYASEIADDVADLRQRIDEWCSADEVSLATSILHNATGEGWSPWGSCDWPPRGTTLEQMARAIDEWATPEPGGPDGHGRVTDEEAGWMREMGLAAMKLDGKRARHFGEKIDKAWSAPLDPETPT